MKLKLNLIVLYLHNTVSASKQRNHFRLCQLRLRQVLKQIIPILFAKTFASLQQSEQKEAPESSRHERKFHICAREAT
jgi:hypothetical protein